MTKPKNLIDFLEYIPPDSYHSELSQALEILKRYPRRKYVGLYLETYTGDNSQRSIVKVGNYRKKDLVSFRVYHAEPGADDAGIVDRYSHHTIESLVEYYRVEDVKIVYKIKSKLELTRVLLMFEWEKLQGKELKDT